MTYTESRDQNVRQVHISQQMQWATSLVTLTPTSGLCLLMRPSQQLPPLLTHKQTKTHSHTRSDSAIQLLKATGEQLSVSGLTPAGGDVLCKRVWGSADRQARCCVSTTAHTTEQRIAGHSGHLSTDRIRIKISPHQVFWAGREWQDAKQRLPSVSQQ